MYKDERIFTFHVGLIEKALPKIGTQESTEPVTLIFGDLPEGPSGGLIHTGLKNTF